MSRFIDEAPEAQRKDAASLWSHSWTDPQLDRPRTPHVASQCPKQAPDPDGSSHPKARFKTKAPHYRRARTQGFPCVLSGGSPPPGAPPPGRQSCRRRCSSPRCLGSLRGTRHRVLCCPLRARSPSPTPSADRSHCPLQKWESFLTALERKVPVVMTWV